MYCQFSNPILTQCIYSQQYFHSKKSAVLDKDNLEIPYLKMKKLLQVAWPFSLSDIIQIIYWKTGKNYDSMFVFLNFK